MMSDAFQSIKQGLAEAIEYAQGQTSGAIVHEFAPLTPATPHNTLPEEDMRRIIRISTRSETKSGIAGWRDRTTGIPANQ